MRQFGYSFVVSLPPSQLIALALSCSPLRKFRDRMAEDRLDIVIFGATGYTGKFAVKEAARLARETHFTWGIADRCKEDLESMLKEFVPESENVKIIVADVQNEGSLRKMTEQTKVLVNCCSPFRFYGEPVIKACIATRTHQVDNSGEPQYIERIEMNYNKSARDAGIYIVNGCGIEALPHEMGIVHTQDKFDGEINSVESFVSVWTSPNVKGVLFHYDKWMSNVHHAAHLDELRSIREQSHPENMPEFEPKLEFKRVVHRSNVTDGWSRIYLSANTHTSRRTQRYFYENYRQRPIQLQTYITFKSWWHFLRATVVGGSAYLIARNMYGRSLVLRYPKFFSGGMASHEGPTRRGMQNTHYSLTFHARGWSKKLSSIPANRKDPPNKEMITRVTGINPQYGLSNVTLLVSALMILRESDKIPNEGGVLTPGAAFRETSMIDELNKHGLKFEVVSVIVDDSFVL